MPGRHRRRRALTFATASALGVAAWEVTRRADARRIAADPEDAELRHPRRGEVVEVRSADGTRLHAEVFGPEGAPTIVLVHGWTCSHDFWHYQVRDLAGEFRVVTYDQRGHGRSEPPHVADYSPDALAVDLDAVLDACVPSERCVVAGHSMGGMTVVAWAGRNPDAVPRRLAATMLVDTGMGDLVAQSRVLPMPGSARLGAALAARALAVPLHLGNRSTPISHRAVRVLTMGPGASPARVAFCERMTLECPAHVRAGFGVEIPSIDLYTGVPSLRVPTVVVVGEKDRLTPPWHARRLAESLPDLVDLVELPGIGHMAPIEAPERISALLRDLTRAHLGSTAGTEVTGTAIPAR